MMPGSPRLQCRYQHNELHEHGIRTLFAILVVTAAATATTATAGCTRPRRFIIATRHTLHVLVIVAIIHYFLHNVVRHLALRADLLVLQIAVQSIELFLVHVGEYNVRPALLYDAHINRLATRHAAAESTEDDLVDIGKVDESWLFGDEEERLLEQEQLALCSLEVALDTRLASGGRVSTGCGGLDANESAEECDDDLVLGCCVFLLELALVLVLERLLVEVELDFHLITALEHSDDVRILGLTLPDRRVEADLCECELKQRK